MSCESKPSNLHTLIGQNAWITAPSATFRSYFKHMAVRQGPKWPFLVRTDADLMSAWLSGKQDVKDADVVQMHSREADAEAVNRNIHLEMLVLPPSLLVLNLGVKAARNSAMPEVFLEALRMRQYMNKPTWVVDQPTYPFRDGVPSREPNRRWEVEPHIAFSDAALDLMSTWKRVKIKTPVAQKRVATAPALPPLPTLTHSEEDEETTRPTLKAPSPSMNGTVSVLPLNEEDDEPTPKKKPYRRGRW